ncbi:hypothetical protein [Botrimarina hoheduenensis]|uniref:Response regulatory domain-containing protein n=1 Tax=Botrimarina hoheduenensis TaxID=2528000 RepID=A0A5C5VXF5_9BACT|nr:hypothetical protein [Botrimarina hoheduenensis]TWT42665.1 hypothetical protein Pla111_26380 [Botrimarina hoheduenensis]
MSQIRSPGGTVRPPTPTPRTTPRLSPTPRSVRSFGDCASLVLVTDPARRRAVTQAAQSAGWRVVACQSPDETAAQVQQWRLQFAIVELAAGDLPQRSALRQSVQQLREASSPLLIVADQAPTHEDELWARQIGAWLYLPAMTVGEELTQLCREALYSVRRQATAQAPVG